MAAVPGFGLGGGRPRGSARGSQPLAIPLLDEELDARASAARTEEVPMRLVLKCREPALRARLRWHAQLRCRVERQVLLTAREE